MDRDEETAGKSRDEVANVGYGEREDEFTTTLSLENAARKPARKRKVSFPEDASIISKSVEPVNPWADVSEISSSDVIQAYISVCGRFRVKPIDKLIKQLKEYDVFHGRIDVLDMKGVKLDLKSCEAIEEVLKKVQVYMLDLENTNLEDEGAIAFAEMIEFYHSAVQIHIGYNPRIKTRGWQMFSQMLKKTTFVDHVDLRHCCFNDSSTALMARSLKINTSLRVLHLEGDNLSGKLLIILCAGLKLNTNLSELFLGDNFLVPSDASTLAAMLKSNFTLQLLDVRNNMLQDQGLLYLCEGLKHQSAKGGGGGVRMLVLWNNQITKNGMVPLANLLALTQNIQTLNIGHNRLGNDGIRNLQIGLLKNRSLLRLGVLNTKITAEGAVALAEYIADTRSLLRVDLRENDLFVGGLMALTLAVKINQTVVRIDLDKDLKKEQGMEETQTALLVEIYQHLEGNKKLAIKREEARRMELQQKLECEARMAEERLRNQQCPGDSQASEGVNQPANPGDVSPSRFTVSPVASIPDKNPTQSSGDERTALEPNPPLVDTTLNNPAPSVDPLTNNHIDIPDLSARGVHVRNFHDNDVTIYSSDDKVNSGARGVHVDPNTNDTEVMKSGDLLNSCSREVHVEHEPSGSNVLDNDDVDSENSTTRELHAENTTELGRNNINDNIIADDLTSRGVHAEIGSNFQEHDNNLINPDLNSRDAHVNTNSDLPEDRGSAPAGTKDVSRAIYSHDNAEFGEVFVLDADVGVNELPSNIISDDGIPREQKREVRDSLLYDEDMLATELDGLLLEDSGNSEVMYNGDVETQNAPLSRAKDTKSPEITDLNPEDFDKEMDELLAGVKIDLTELPSPQDDDDFWNKDMQDILQSSTTS